MKLRVQGAAGLTSAPGAFFRARYQDGEAFGPSPFLLAGDAVLARLLHDGRDVDALARVRFERVEDVPVTTISCPTSPMAVCEAFRQPGAEDRGSEAQPGRARPQRTESRTASRSAARS
jgi:hypothetical protein